MRKPAVRSDKAGGGTFSGAVRTTVVDVVRESTPRKGIIAFYAAGIGVMVLLFMAAGAGGGLLDEVDTETLERVLTAGLGMTGLLAGKWLYGSRPADAHPQRPSVEGQQAESLAAGPGPLAAGRDLHGAGSPPRPALGDRVATTRKTLGPSASE